MHRVLMVSAVVAGLVCTTALNGLAHCGKCEGDDHDHDHALKEYKKGVCCSAEHYAKEQKKAIAAKAKKDYKEGACCSAEHFAKEKVKAAEVATIKAKAMKEYTKDMCCSAEHYAEKKVAAAAKKAQK